MSSDDPLHQAKRLVSTRQLPPYSYVTGKFPHPTRDERGHSFEAEQEQVELADASQWRNCEAYLWGIDLFNNGYYWEAHETWEAVWHAAGRSGTLADFCKALIKLAAAGVKAREGRLEGVKRHARRAAELLERVTAREGESQPVFMGLSLSELIEKTGRLLAAAESVIDTSDEPVVAVMPFLLTITE